MLQNKIEILSVQLLDNEKQLVEEMRRVSEELNLGLGWHYLLDLSWAASILQPSSGMKVIDAGAGMGTMQWWLAEHGVNVISIDRQTRKNIPISFKKRCRIQIWGEGDVSMKPNLYDFLPSISPYRWHLYPQKLITTLQQVRNKPKTAQDSGTIFIYNKNITSMTDILDNSVDAVVSISALEHNPPDDIKICVAELMRVLKPGGKLIATIGAAKKKDWFHEPSRGWCYTEPTLRDIFNLPSDCTSNYGQYDKLFEELCNCSELRDNLADAYFKSGNNGMPWGIWDPKYQSVGVVKVKS